MPTLSELMSGIRGASSLTAGTVKYPAAGLMMLLDQAGIGNDIGKSGRLTWKQALDLINQQAEEDRINNPKATMAGNLAGAVTLGALTGGAALPTSGLNLARGLATQTALGGIQGYTEKEDAGDLASGASLGAIFGLGGQAVNKTVGYLADREITNAAKAWLKKYKSQKVKADSDSGPVTKLPLAPSLQEVKNNLIESIQLEPLASSRLSFSGLRNVGTPYDVTNNEIRKNLMVEAIKDAGYGGIAGGAIAAAAGEDPLKGVIIGGGVNLARGKQAIIGDSVNAANKVALRYAAANSQVVPSISGALTNTGTQIGNKIQTQNNVPIQNLQTVPFEELPMLPWEMTPVKKSKKDIANPEEDLPPLPFKD